ncbi:hypothetical protein U0035_10980 [Niabella yanshanensis]|uniref:Uncharacterized protein n=1 Tax=Niabella yanshanensis TaxID=577386 RepID=A0ABZ0WDA5_9BACT|nr:hypothetical protein [Niabella yanshanensis]WQD40671.1 hypothetical protein U0035_10980 [Niabella yanshanensis]
MQSKKIEITDYDYQFPLNKTAGSYASLNVYKHIRGAITPAANIQFYYVKIPAGAPNRVDFEEAYAHTSLPATLLPRIIGLLRNEKPVFIWFYSNNSVRISSSRENVGDNDQA